MNHLLRSHLPRRLTHGLNRSLSTVVDTTPRAPLPAKAASRPLLNIAVKPDHGLWAFFRKRERNGKIEFDSVEGHEGLFDKTGRSWSAAELRRKSFRDLHTLWYILLRERNLIATHVAELRRLGISPSGMTMNTTRELQCRKSMARIKYIINERRLTYDGAIGLFVAQKDTHLQTTGVEKSASQRAAGHERKQVSETKGFTALGAATSALNSRVHTHCST